MYIRSITLFIGVLALSSCEKEIIEETTPTVTANDLIVLADREDGKGLCANHSYHLETFGYSGDPNTYYRCVLPWRDCAKIVPCSTLMGLEKNDSESIDELLGKFVKGVNKKDVRNFFSNEDYSRLFPQLLGDASFIEQLRSGQIQFKKEQDASGDHILVARMKNKNAKQIVIQIPG